MSRAQVLYLHLATALTAVTGIVFAVMKYAMTSDDPFSVVNHPLQPWMLAAHVVIAPALVFGFGWIFGNHIWPKYLNPRAQQRKSGVPMMWILIPMTLSGYLLQVSTNETTRKAMAIAHWVTSGVFVVAYVVHLATKPRR